MYTVKFFYFKDLIKVTKCPFIRSSVFKAYKTFFSDLGGPRAIQDPKDITAERRNEKTRSRAYPSHSGHPENRTRDKRIGPGTKAASESV